MYLKCNRRVKDGKEHRYWSIMENRRCGAGRVVPRAALQKFATIQMLDAHFPTTDGRWLIFARYTQPEKDHRLLLAQLELQLPPQAPPRITAKERSPQ
jgi:hypothetical protein